MPGSKQLTSAEARAALITAAVAHVETVGVSLGITEELVEQLAQTAGLPKKQFQKIWDSPQHFLADVCWELAERARIDRADSQTLLTTWQFLSTRREDLQTLQGRRRLLVDIVRTAAEYNFNAVTATGKWRSYAALSTTIDAWPDDAARERLHASLRASELAFIETMESFYTNVLPTLGFRLKPQFAGDYRPFVVASAAVIEGLGIVRSTVPEIVERRFEVEAQPWSVAALAFVGVVDAFIEPAPDFDVAHATARLGGGVELSP